MNLKIQHVLGVVPIRDFERSLEWYRRFFDADPTNIPMPGILAEWRLVESGWLQITVNEHKAGSGFFNLAVDDFDATVEQLRAREFEVGDLIEAMKDVHLAPIVDPDGNQITLIGNFREQY